MILEVQPQRFVWRLHQGGGRRLKSNPYNWTLILVHLISSHRLLYVIVGNAGPTAQPLPTWFVLYVLAIALALAALRAHTPPRV